MKTLTYICLVCGNKILIEYNNDNGVFIAPSHCNNCEFLLDEQRVKEIVETVINERKNDESKHTD